jgi:hypothetical protein
VLLVFNLEEIELIQWFEVQFGLAINAFEDGEQGQTVPPEHSLESSAAPNSVVFNMDSMRLTDILTESMTTDGLFARLQPSAETNVCACSVFDLKSVSLLEILAS